MECTTYLLYALETLVKRKLPDARWGLFERASLAWVSSQWRRLDDFSCSESSAQQLTYV